MLAVQILCLAAAGASAQVLQGELTVASGTDTGIFLNQILLPSNSRTEISYPIDGSLLQSSALSGSGTHKFMDGDSLCSVFLRNSTTESAVLLCEGSPPLNITYPHANPIEGCLPSALIKGTSISGRVFYIEFSGPCTPLRVHVDTSRTPRVSIEFSQYLSGKQIRVLKGGNEYGEEVIYYVYLENRNIGIVSTNDGPIEPILVTNIGGCSSASSVTPVPSHPIHPTKLGFMVDCVDSAGIPLRYRCLYDLREETVTVEPVSVAGGVVRVSENGKILMIITLRNEMHSMMLYSMTNISSTPVRIQFEEGIQTQFLMQNNKTFLLVCRERRNMELLDIGLILSSLGSEGKWAIPTSIVQTCNPIPFHDIITENILMFALPNPHSHLYDIKYVPINSDRVSTILSVASWPPVFTGQLQLVSSPPVTEPEEMTTPDIPALDTTVFVDTTEMPITRANPARTSIKFPLWAIALIVGIILIVTTLPLLIICIACTVKRRSKKQSDRPITTEAVQETPAITFSVQVTQSHSNSSLSTASFASTYPSPNLQTRHSISGCQ